MSLTAHPPVYGPAGSNAEWRSMMAPIEQGAKGWPAFAIQRVVGVTADGAFGPVTDQAVRAYQRKRNLVADGICGPATQRNMLLNASAKVEAKYPAIPAGLLAGMIQHEGVGILAPVNYYTPPGQTRGCDCGPVQWRQYEPYTLAALRKAFDPVENLAHGGSVFAGRFKEYRQRRPSLTERRARELAALAHNAPFLAEQFIRNGKLTTPNAVAQWTVKSTDGKGNVTARYTHAEWAAEYPRRILSHVK